MDIEIVYGSTTGNTEDLAETIALKLKHPKININVFNVSSLSYNYRIKSNINIWCCSTWGIDPPCLQEDFEEFINSKIDIKYIKNSKFVIFALGDRYYPYFAYSGNILEDFIKKNGGSVLLQPLKIQDPWENSNDEIDKVLLQLIESLDIKND